MKRVLEATSNAVGEGICAGWVSRYLTKAWRAKDISEKGVLSSSSTRMVTGERPIRERSAAEETTTDGGMVWVSGVSKLRMVWGVRSSMIVKSSWIRPDVTMRFWLSTTTTSRITSRLASLRVVMGGVVGGC